MKLPNKFVLEDRDDLDDVHVERVGDKYHFTYEGDSVPTPYSEADTKCLIDLFYRIKGSQ
jgi:hypothetical protein